ncbi:hypothetical protein Bca4012_035774 [Brassica carinata]
MYHKGSRAPLCGEGTATTVIGKVTVVGAEHHCEKWLQSTSLYDHDRDRGGDSDYNFEAAT